MASHQSDRVRSWVSEFLAYLASERAVARNTVTAYQGDLEQFVEFCLVRKVSVPDATLKNLRDFVAHLRRQDLAPRSIARKVAAVRQLYRFLMREGHIECNPSELLTVTVKERKLPKSLTRREIFALVAAAKGEDDGEIRDRALLEIWYGTGARVSELVHLKAADLDWEKGFVKVTGKGNRERLIPVGTQALQWAARYRDVRSRWLAEKGLDAIDYFFLSRAGKRCTRQALWKIVKKYALKAGIPRRVWPHMIRHTFATHVLRGGADLRVVQEMLGHRSVATTEVYTHLDVRNLKLMQSKFHPRG